MITAWNRRSGLAPWFWGRFPRLRAAWCLLRGWPVAYRARIENGGFAVDGSVPGLYFQCTVTGPSLAVDPETGQAACPDGKCWASGQAAVTGRNISSFRFSPGEAP